MEQSCLFNILNSVDSTNNYAMAKVHEGLAINGMAWFAHHQTGGKGQRGKQWESKPGENIVLSIILKPAPIFRSKPFCLSALIALSCYDFLKNNATGAFTVKWPNDLYLGDRKAGGILIENVYAGSEWKWAIAGIGININQSDFDPAIKNAVSLSKITGVKKDPVLLAKALHQQVLERFNSVTQESYNNIMNQYNAVLFKKDALVKLRHNNIVFSTTVKSVNESGQLITEDVMERSFDFGTVEWIMD